jgi:hypothetical protein
MKKIDKKDTCCNGIIGSSVCRLGNNNKVEVDIWQCMSCRVRLCTACMRINKYLNMIGNIRLS